MRAAMERRRSARVRHRLPAEIVHGVMRHPGFLFDVSPHGAFIQMECPIGAGEEIELWFADDQLAPQVARARVVRRRGVPGAGTQRSGVGIEWLHAPQFARDLDDGGIEVEIDTGAIEGPASTPEAAAAWEASRAAEPEAPPTVPVVVGDIVALDVPPVVERTLELGPIAIRADVVVIDEGELGSVVEIAESLGARTLRMRWGAQADPVIWEAPPQLVIVSARIAMVVPLGDAVLAVRARGIAVCDSEAQTLRARLRRQGYELVVQRNTHPATLRLLLASLLFQRRERRRERRRAFGAQIGFWRGFRRQHGTLLELSASGGSLLLVNDLPRGTKLTVRVPRKHVGTRTLALPGTVARTSPAEGGVLVGVRFEALSARKRARLDALIRALDTSGPVPHESPIAGATRWSGTRARGERRACARVRIAQQALALDEQSGVARDVLFGTDLSLGGMRVEPHPRLTRGAELQLALQPPGGAPTVKLRAEVTRDDGERGLVLRFLAVSPAVRLALERMLDAASEIERTRRNRAAREERVVLGTLVEADQPSR